MTKHIARKAHPKDGTHEFYLTDNPPPACVQCWTVEDLAGQVARSPDANAGVPGILAECLRRLGLPSNAALVELFTAALGQHLAQAHSVHDKTAVELDKTKRRLRAAASAAGALHTLLGDDAPVCSMLAKAVHRLCRGDDA